MESKRRKNKERIIELLRQRIEHPDSLQMNAEAKITEHEISVLLNELQVFELELEMQNDELKLSYELLEAERLKFAGFFNQAPVGYFVLDYIGSIEEANQTGADLLNATKKNILGKRFQSFITPNDLENFYFFLHRMKGTGIRQNFEIKLSLHNEQEIYTRMEGVAVINTTSGKIQYYITVVDTTESRIAQQLLVETSQRLKLTLSASSTGTWTMEMSRNRIFLDDFSYTVLGIDTWDFDGTVQRFITFVHPDDQQLVRAAFLGPQQGDGRIELEFRIETQSGAIKEIYALGQQVEGAETHAFFAGILMDITPRKELSRQAENAQEEKQKLILAATFEAQERERDRISSALHDSICQILYGIKLNFQNLKVAGKTAEMQNVNKLLDQAIQETREISYELTPSVLRDFGFAAGIKEISQRFSGFGLKIHAEVEDDLDTLPGETQLYLFRVVQELVNNCIKHAQAKIAEINIFTEDGWLMLVVRDNGKGFDVENEQAWLKGSGLRGIKNRIVLLNGEIKVESNSSGTKTTISVKKDRPNDG
ncbi:PAS domain-containing sensor histidine kinase [Pedobacter duraquae]|uniref:histidine kinase n=1 Tax=Pedobacter duraquae TaxID=425511 RepID=A0A4R6IKV7_9SPHI|nr:sensor histidine kinase [Pedobacter duraquae]TDO22693.1 PAS domain-containing protein [Pedobacter duraquae]